MVLNVAEGNGRFSVLEQHKFWDTANSAAAKAAGYLDMGTAKGIWKADRVAEVKEWLARIGTMTARKRGG